MKNFACENTIHFGLEITEFLDWINNKKWKLKAQIPKPSPGNRIARKFNGVVFFTWPQKNFVHADASVM